MPQAVRSHWSNSRNMTAQPRTLSRSPSIVVIGSSNADLTLRLPRLPRPGETISGGHFETVPGGKGANQAVAAARAGGRVTFVSRLGRDAFGSQFIRNFRRDRIDTRFIQSDRQEPTGVALIYVDRKGENCIGVAAGANARLSPSDVRRASPAIARARMVLVQLETPMETVAAVVEVASEAGVPILLNPAPALRLPAQLLRRIAYLTPNESEAEQLTGIRVNRVAAATRAARQLRERGVGSVVLTLGARGSLIVTEGYSRRIPAFPVTPIDTTAAGDVFNGALAVALAEQRPLPEAVRFASAAAALSVTRPGAQPSAPARKEIEALLRSAPARGGRSPD